MNTKLSCVLFLAASAIFASAPTVVPKSEAAAHLDLAIKTTSTFTGSHFAPQFLHQDQQIQQFHAEDKCPWCFRPSCRLSDSDPGCWDAWVNYTACLDWCNTMFPNHEAAPGAVERRETARTIDRPRTRLFIRRT